MSRNEAVGGEVGPGMAAHRGFGNKPTCFINRLFYRVGGGFVVLRDVSSNIENVRFGERRKSVLAHRLDKRQSSFMA
jgi:hypothetical protein